MRWRFFRETFTGQSFQARRGGCEELSYHWACLRISVPMFAGHYSYLTYARTLLKSRASGNISTGLWIQRATRAYFMLSAKRDAWASERFFRKALKSTHNQEPFGFASRLRRETRLQRWTHREL